MASMDKAELQRRRDLNMRARVESFIESLSSPFPEYLEQIYRSAKSRDIPVIRESMADFLKTLLAVKKPMSILEIGAAVGFSALYMRYFTDDGCRIVTVENYPPRIQEARDNFKQYDPDGRITLLEGDAGEYLRRLCGKSGDKDESILEAADAGFDLIFLDGPKGQYPAMYEDLKSLIRPGGVLLVDNVFHDGDIFESRYAIERRDRTIHARLREFLYNVTHDPEVTTSILDIADGVALCVKNG